MIAPELVGKQLFYASLIQKTNLDCLSTKTKETKKYVLHLLTMKRFFRTDLHILTLTKRPTNDLFIEHNRAVKSASWQLLSRRKSVSYGNLGEEVAVYQISCRSTDLKVNSISSNRSAPNPHTGRSFFIGCVRLMQSTSSKYQVSVGWIVSYSGHSLLNV